MFCCFEEERKGRHAPTTRRLIKNAEKNPFSRSDGRRKDVVVQYTMNVHGLHAKHAQFSVRSQTSDFQIACGRKHK